MHDHGHCQVDESPAIYYFTILLLQEKKVASSQKPEAPQKDLKRKTLTVWIAKLKILTSNTVKYGGICMSADPTQQHDSIVQIKKQEMGDFTEEKTGTLSYTYLPFKKNFFKDLSRQNFFLQNRLFALKYKMSSQCSVYTWNTNKKNEIAIDVHVALTVSCPSFFVSVWFWLFLRKDMVYRWAREYAPEDHTDQACEYSHRQPNQSI